MKSSKYLQNTTSRVQGIQVIRLQPISMKILMRLFIKRTSLNPIPPQLLEFLYIFIFHSAMKNVFFDTAALPFIYESGLFDVIDKIIGHDKVIFGTDFPLMEQSRMYDEIVNSNLSDTAKADILYNNGFKLLHRDRSL